MQLRNCSRLGQHGMSLIEVLIALVILTLGILGLARLFPSGSRAQVQDRLMTSAGDFAQDRLEQLASRSWSDSLLTVGRHPAGTATESLDGGTWHRFHTVTQLASPLDNLKKVVVTVSYHGAGLSTDRTVTVTTYVRR